MKICNKCHIEKPYTEFSKCKNAPDGLQWTCRQCQSKNGKNNYRQNSVIRKQNNKKLNYSISPAIYKITCLINNKCYIGQSIQPYKRSSIHFSIINDNSNYQTSFSLQNDLKQYGRNNFKFEILEYCSPELLLERESYYIGLFNPEYNKKGAL